MKKLLLVLLLSLFAMGNVFAVVDINTADEAALDSVKGIGPAKAKAIVEERGKNGLYKSVDDLARVKGFGKKTIDKLKPELTASGAPAAVATPTSAAPPAKADKGK